MTIHLPNIPGPDTKKAAFIAENAAIAGDVTLGEGSSVWFGATIRADGGHPVTIGKESNIQDGSILHADESYAVTLGDRVSVGHGAVIHGCTLDDLVLVGMHATVLNGAHVGKGSLIAAGALVTEHAEIPPYSLVVGVPGKIRPLSEEQKQYVDDNWKEYVHLAGLYSASTQK